MLFWEVRNEKANLGVFEKKGKRHHRSELVGFDAVGCGWVCLVCGAFVKGLGLKGF